MGDVLLFYVLFQSHLAGLMVQESLLPIKIAAALEAADHELVLCCVTYI